jgi:hypothetical protein
MGIGEGIGKLVYTLAAFALVGVVAIGYGIYKLF